MTGRPLGSKNSYKSAHKNGRNVDLAEQAASYRRQFIRNLRDYGEPSAKVKLEAVTGIECGLYPTCKRTAAELWIWGGLHSEYLCETELTELRQK